ncbi:MGH1-like glycoside hydrolase domain-containing protein [Pedobacter glucosidilyticus]|uniref:MGH1-like glycoside hydrolase domain-containing protein n=1 Tax=Pedobacter glucosidilyticus TaxID=1122941 RepID=UPI0026ECB882|nr:trehalase family glycosidase [Pedobacter glucosidilyticus]
MKIKLSYLLFFCLSLPFYSAQAFQHDAYLKVQENLKQGWHTYNHSSILSYVYMPGNFSVKLSLKSNNIGLYGYMGDAYISTKVKRPEHVFPIAYSANGDYSEVLLTYEGIEVNIKSANINDELYLLVTPIKYSGLKPTIVLEGGILWNANGTVQKDGHTIIAQLPQKKIQVQATQRATKSILPINNPYLAFDMEGKIGFTSKANLTLAAIEQAIETVKLKHQKNLEQYKNQAEMVSIIQNAIGFNTTYDPLNDRVITPVSRYWSESFGGPFVLFAWDTYFGAYMAALFNKDLAFSNAIAITKSLTPGGFVPNYTSGESRMSADRSQPPVGSTMIREIYRKHPEKWFLEYVFDDLLSWNNWWVKSRATSENLLCWGSDSLGDASANTWQAAAYESGLDNSPMFIDVPFNKNTHLMEQADVGLQALFIMDCEALADIAQILGKQKIAKQLKDRAAIYKKALTKLWDQETGQYLNYRTDIKAFNQVTSPTNFYPLLINLPKQSQADRMISHLQNPEEYAGDWIIPSIPKNNKYYQEHDYWKGRVWGPLNLLVYLGLRNYNTTYKAELVEKSAKLLVDNYKATGGYVYENYHAIAGVGRTPDEIINQSDNFYHWGALLGFISLIDEGYMGKPLQKISK